MAIAMATGHLGPKIFSQVKANYICSNIGPMGTLAATSQLSVSGNQGVPMGGSGLSRITKSELGLESIKI